MKVSALSNSSLPNVSWFQLLIVAEKNENLYREVSEFLALALIRPSPSIKILSVSTKVTPENYLVKEN